MDRPLSYANQITVNTRRKGTVVVQVIERRNAKQNDAGTQFRNYMVTDTMGTKVPIVLFGSSIAFFANTLLPFKRYYISNAIVTVTTPAYKVVEYDYTWSLRQRHLVEPYEEAIPPSLPCTFPFNKFSELYRFADQARPICIKALVIHALPAQEVDESSTVRDFVVIDEEKIPMLLRVWDDLMIETDVNVHARYKVPALIVAYGLKVTTHNGLSLGTRTNAYILHNPPLNEDRPLNEWYTANSAAITWLLETRAYRDTTVLYHPPALDEIIPLTDAISSIENVKTIWTKGKLTYLPGQEKLWFEACKNCFRPIDADLEWNIWCSNCQECTKVIVRGTVNVFLSHGGIVVEATIKSPATEKLIPFTATELMVVAEKNTPLTRKVEAALENKDVICFLKFYDRPSRGSVVRRYPLLRIYTGLEVEEYHKGQESAASEQAVPQARLLAPPIKNIVQGIGSSSSTTNAYVEKQLFTPTASKVLKEILQANSIEPVPDDSSTCAKRMLSFDDTQPKNATVQLTIQPGGPSTTSNPTHAGAHPLPEDTVHTSPSKKMKGKDAAA